ncbi:MAG: methyltransferase domain-containing protein [Burkholderiales bacterium]|jgi:SAM-dependent methyltransferase|nr:methyltransferase domain-containing protein [Burkholderiales bacterium]
MREKHEAGHMLLAKLGKKRLRPGGKRATDWLIRQAEIGTDTKILEVACNMGTTAIELAQRYKCHIIGIDLNEAALEKARRNTMEQGLTDHIQFMRGNARELPFEDTSFDIIINEAMLTMLNEKDKLKALREYMRVLKPGGYLLTHDLIIRNDNENREQIVDRLRATIHVNASPLTEEEWNTLLSEQGFLVKTLTGPMSLLSPTGMIRDEGFVNTLLIIKNALKPQYRSMFLRMFQLFRRSKNQFGFIAACSRKSF